MLVRGRNGKQLNRWRVLVLCLSVIIFISIIWQLQLLVTLQFQISSRLLNMRSINEKNTTWNLKLQIWAELSCWSSSIILSNQLYMNTIGLIWLDYWQGPTSQFCSDINAMFSHGAWQDLLGGELSQCYHMESLPDSQNKDKKIWRGVACPLALPLQRWVIKRKHGVLHNGCF